MTSLWRNVVSGSDFDGTIYLLITEHCCGWAWWMDIAHIGCMYSCSVNWFVVLYSNILMISLDLRTVQRLLQRLKSWPKVWSLGKCCCKGQWYADVKICFYWSLLVSQVLVSYLSYYLDVTYWAQSVEWIREWIWYSRMYDSNYSTHIFLIIDRKELLLLGLFGSVHVLTDV